MKPLKQFVCDSCSEIIETPADGMMEWVYAVDDTSENHGKAHSFRIVHRLLKSPRPNGGCSQHKDKLGYGSKDLDQVIDEKSIMANLLKYLDIGSIQEPEYKGPRVVNLREYVEIFRRLTIPYYEEARIYWDKAIFDGIFGSPNEYHIYDVRTLRGIISKYKSIGSR